MTAKDAVFVSFYNKFLQQGSRKTYQRIQRPQPDQSEDECHDASMIAPAMPQETPGAKAEFVGVALVFVAELQTLLMMAIALCSQEGHSLYLYADHVIRGFAA